VLGVVLRILGIGALVAGGLAVALAALIAAILLGPLISGSLGTCSTLRPQ
jgi:hypothetical protein